MKIKVGYDSVFVFNDHPTTKRSKADDRNVRRPHFTGSPEGHRVRPSRTVVHATLNLICRLISLGVWRYL